MVMLLRRHVLFFLLPLLPLLLPLPLVAANGRARFNRDKTLLNRSIILFPAGLGNMAYCHVDQKHLPLVALMQIGFGD